MGKKQLREKTIEMHEVSKFFNEIDLTTTEIFVKLLHNNMLTEKVYQLVCGTLVD